MKKRKAIKEYKQAVINAVILAVILVLFIYLGVQLSRNFSTTVSTQRTQLVTDREYISLSGYVFRDETVVNTDGENGIVDYRMPDGAKVGVDQTYAVFYPKSDASREQLNEIQEQINALTLQIERLQAEKGVGTIADLSHVEADIAQAYYGYVDALQRGEINESTADGKLLLEALVDYTVLTGRDGKPEEIVSKLQKQKEALLSYLGVTPKALTAERSCYFFQETDGYEAVFTSNALEGLTPAGLQELAGQGAASYGSDVIGKKIYHPKWYLALPVAPVLCESFAEGEIYSVIYPEADDRTVSMTLERVVADETGAYLLFSSYDLVHSADLQRSQQVKILMNELSGYRIPAESLTALNGEDGVYILIGTVVEFRRVTVIGEGNGYYLVATYEQDRSAAEEIGAENPVPYLYINDLIITSGNDLYDGKLLD